MKSPKPSGSSDIDSAVPQAGEQFLASYASGRRDFEGLQLENGTLSVARVDLRALSAPRARLKRSAIAGSNLDDVDFREADLQGFAIYLSTCRRGRFDNAKMIHVRASATNFEEASLRSADIRWGDLRQAQLHRAQLVGATLRWAMLQGADLTDADLEACELHGALADAATRWPRNFDVQRSGAIVPGAQLSGVRMKRARIPGAWLVGADLSGAYLPGAWLLDADLREVDFRRANLRGAHFFGSQLDHAKLGGAILQRARFYEVSLANAELGQATYDSRTQWPPGFDPVAAGALGPGGEAWVGASLEGARIGCIALPGQVMRNVDLRSAYLFRAKLQRADLREARLDHAMFAEVDLSDADLRGASACRCDFFRADLRGAKLDGADLRGASLRRADLRGVDLSVARLDETTILLEAKCS
jgi:uncharacterized protein YjbI with pentapeptide repeats